MYECLAGTDSRELVENPRESKRRCALSVFCALWTNSKLTLLQDVLQCVHFHNAACVYDASRSVACSIRAVPAVLHLSKTTFKPLMSSGKLRRDAKMARNGM